MLTINIDSTNRTNEVEKDTFSIDRKLTNKIDTCRFDYVTSDVTAIPELNDVVQVMNGLTKEFEGKITNINEYTSHAGLYKFRIHCQDYVYDVDGKLLAEIFENETVYDILDYVNTKYSLGLTLNGVDGDMLIKYVQFRYESFSTCIQRLCDMTGYDWNIDYDKDLQFFDYHDNASPFEFEDEGVYRTGTVQINKDITNIKNKVYVKGGDYQADPIQHTIIANGVDKIYLLPYKFSEISFTYNGAPYTDWGLDGINSEDNYAMLFNFNEKLLRFSDTSIPALNDEIVLTGRPNYGVFVVEKDDASIAEFSEKGVLIEEKSYKDKQAARDRAMIELNTYKNGTVELSFDTFEDGLTVGQMMTCNSDVYRMTDEDYRIQNMSITIINDDTFNYTVDLCSTKTLDYVDVMIRLIRAATGRQDITQNEVLALIHTYYETIGFSEVLNTEIDGTAFEYVLAPYPRTTPDDYKREFVLDGSLLYTRP